MSKLYDSTDIGVILISIDEDTARIRLGRSLPVILRIRNREFIVANTVDKLNQEKRLFKMGIHSLFEFYIDKEWPE